MSGLYIHIPFCKSRCIYCGFYSTTRTERRAQYVDALCHEMELRCDEADDPLQTVYLGGGTPSQLSATELSRLFGQVERVYGLADGAEVTIECNPDDVTPAFCRALQSLPVNRVSMGAQTFSDARLRFLRRRHKAADVALAVERLRAVGIANISIDLMFGFPDETLEQWQADITQALALHVEHLSAYSLMIEDGTPLHRLLEQGRIAETDEELYRAMYDTLIDTLTAAGYEHYEISNFALPGHRSRHNSAYWTGAPYIGIGAAAHSYDRKTRSWNVDDIDKYIAFEGVSDKSVAFEGVRTIEMIDERTRYDDLIVTALRTREGINLQSLTPQQADYLHRQAAPFIASGHLRLADGRLAFTRQGIYISDSIMADLMWDE